MHRLLRVSREGTSPGKNGSGKGGEDERRGGKSEKEKRQGGE